MRRAIFDGVQVVLAGVAVVLVCAGCHDWDALVADNARHRDGSSDATGRDMDGAPPEREREAGTGAPATDGGPPPPDSGSEDGGGSAMDGGDRDSAVDGAASGADAGDGGDAAAGDGGGDAEMPAECGAGYTRDSVSGECVDIDECATNHGGCDANATCTGSTTPAAAPACACTADYYGDGMRCDLRLRTVRMASLHGCGLAFDRSLYCWGNNSHGQLGTGDAQIGTKAALPARVGSDSDWDELALGARTSCAIRAGTLHCWGDNQSGDLGLGAGAVGTNRGIPAALAGDDWFGLSAASLETCALRGSGGSGQIYCFGALSGSNVRASAPVLVGDAAARWRAVSTSGDHACAIRADGALFCWGDANYSGELGLGAGVVGGGVVTSPMQVGSAVDWTAIEVGNESSCGLRKGGELWCWGQSRYLPSGGSSIVSSPVQQGVWDDWSAVTLGDGGGPFGCGVRAGGALWCWGWNEHAEAAQEPNVSTSVVPLGRVGSDEGWTQVSAGTETACGVRADRVHCWGSNQAGKLGTLSELRYTLAAPTRVGTADDWSAVSAGLAASCGVRGGTLQCWGWRTDVERLAPAPEAIGSDSGWTQVVTGYIGGAMGMRGGQVYRWGGNDNVAQPTLDPSSFGWTAVAMARGHLPQSWSSIARCALHGSELHCWGENGSGELGVGDMVDRATPTQVAGSWKAVTMGVDHACAISGADELYCWGDAAELGVSAAMDALSPVRVGTSTGWTAVSAAGRNSCAIRAGALYCWTSAPPVQVGTDSDWTAVSVWESSQCAIRGAALYCWGNNASGQLGLPTGPSVPSPTLVDDGASSSWQQISVGSNHSCGIRGDGSLWCWGENRFGQTGVEPSWAQAPRVLELPR